MKTVMKRVGNGRAGLDLLEKLYETNRDDTYLCRRGQDYKLCYLEMGETGLFLLTHSGIGMPIEAFDEINLLRLIP